MKPNDLHEENSIEKRQQYTAAGKEQCERDEQAARSRDRERFGLQARTRDALNAALTPAMVALLRERFLEAGHTAPRAGALIERALADLGLALSKESAP